MEDDHGISHSLKVSPGVQMTMSAFAAIALYNVIELCFVIGITFKKRKGLYFWGFIVATGGILPYTLGFMLKFFDVVHQYIPAVTMIVIGWCCMVTGQSIVLYSRLHLVVREYRILRGVLIMIITDGIICHIPITVLIYGANSGTPLPFVAPYSIYEKIQITIFFLQESIISGIYVFSITRLLQPAGDVKGKSIRTAMIHLIYINVIIILLDLSLLATEYAGHYEIQTLYKATLYSIKLKLEFRILNQLVELTQAKSPREWSWDRTGNSRFSGMDMETLAETFTPSSMAKCHLSASNYGVEVCSGNGTDHGEMKDVIRVLKETKTVIEHTISEPTADNVSTLQDISKTSSRADNMA